MTTLPFFHNLFYGDKYTIFTEDWNYQGDVLGENITFQEQLSQVIETTVTNFHFIIMNPFYYDVYERVGRLLPFVFLTATVIFFFLLFQKKNILKFLERVYKFITYPSICGTICNLQPNFFLSTLFTHPTCIFSYVLSKSKKRI